MTESWFRALLRAYKPLQAVVFVVALGVSATLTGLLRGNPGGEVLGMTASMVLGATIGCALILLLKYSLDAD